MACNNIPKVADKLILLVGYHPQEQTLRSFCSCIPSTEDDTPLEMALLPGSRGYNINSDTVKFPKPECYVFKSLGWTHLRNEIWEMVKQSKQVFVGEISMLAMELL